MGFAIGQNTGATLSSLTTGKSFTPGQTVEDGSGKTWIYVKATTAIVIRDVVYFDITFATAVAPISTANDARGNKVGVAAVAFAVGDYGWLQIYGACTFNVLASCAANVQLNTTATAGSLDDDATSGAFTMLGIFLTTAATGAAATPGILNFPSVGAVI